MNQLRKDAFQIINESIKAVMPKDAVIKALENKDFTNNVTVVAIGKAAWNMAFATKQVLKDKVSKGIVVTKYGHSKGDIEGFLVIEAGHPVPDRNSIKGATKALELVKELKEEDELILLISGGASALFEKPMEDADLEDIIDITSQLLRCGADITEINTIRKHLSKVKGGRFALACNGAKIYAIVLSDVVGDHLDVIASGPAYPDQSTSKDALAIIDKYKLQVSDKLRRIIQIETPKKVPNCETVIVGSVSMLCEAAKQIAIRLCYQALVLSSTLDCEAKEAGRFIASIAREIKSKESIKPPCAVILGGETIVHVKGKGKGGRNQELALSASIGIESLEDVVIFSIGSDGTDGPTDAAGGMVDGESVKRMKEANIDPLIYLKNNDAYHALKASNDLIITGPTGTNVNDLIVLLCQ